MSRETNTSYWIPRDPFFQHVLDFQFRVQTPPTCALSSLFSLFGVIHIGPDGRQKPPRSFRMTGRCSPCQDSRFSRSYFWRGFPAFWLGLALGAPAVGCQLTRSLAGCVGSGVRSLLDSPVLDGPRGESIRVWTPDLGHAVKCRDGTTKSDNADRDHAEYLACAA